MQTENLMIPSSCDQLQLSTTIMIPDTIRGIFQISHGMAEHKERYYPFMVYLSSLGFVTIIHDHRGHGQSVKVHDDLGYFYDTKGDYIVEDLHQLTRMMKERFPDVPVVLFGHSMGSLVVRKYLKKYDHEIDQLIVCGSPSKNPLASIGKILAKTLSMIFGDHARSDLIQMIAFGSFNKDIDHPISKNAWLSVNEENVRTYDADSLCGYTFTNNGFINLFQLMIDTYSSSNWKLKNLDLPILFISGKLDPCMTSLKAWEASQTFLKNLGYTNVNCHLFENMRHEILLEKNNQEVQQVITEFIEGQL